MDSRIAVVPPFRTSTVPRRPWLQTMDRRRFESADEGLVASNQGTCPDGMVRAIGAFMEFCYLVRRSEISEDISNQIHDALARFHAERQPFIQHGIREDFLLPRSPSLIHYATSIPLFGAPNGLCSSITESKHIKAVKEPYRRSSLNKALGQIPHQPAA